MKEARARLLKDHAVIGEGVPMISASGTDIRINDVVYTATADVDPYDRDEPKFEFKVWRVIQINYKERYYRIRCATGCEQSIHHDNGCPKMKVFHSFMDAQEDVIRCFQKEAEDNRKKAKKLEAEAQELIELCNSVMCGEAPPAPEPIATEAHD